MSRYTTLQRFVRPATQHPRAFAKAIFRQTLIALSGPINVRFIGQIGNILEAKNIELFYPYIIGYIGYILTEFVIKRLARDRDAFPGLYFQQFIPIQDLYFKKFLTISSNHLDQLGTGKLISIINSGIEKWSALICQSIGFTVGFLVNFIFGIIFTAQWGRPFVLGYIGVFMGIFTVVLMIDAPLNTIRKERRIKQQDYSRGLVRFIMSKNDILQNDQLKQETERLGENINECVNLTKKQIKKQYWMFTFPGLIINICRIITYLYGAYLYFRQMISISTLTTYIGFLFMIDKIVTSTIEGYYVISREKFIILNLWSLFDDAPQDDGIFAGSDFVYSHGDIAIYGMGFTYDQGKTVFTNLNLTLSGSRKIALVGPSGGGKSTLMKLIAGYIRPSTGSILIDQQNLTDVSLKSYYKTIGYLTQEPSVFDGSIRENLLYGMMDTDVSTTHIDHIIHLSKCEWIYDCAQGLDTQIGEKGILLSGGQKQRLAIAKIMLKNPHIILLDEPTSALDSINEELVTEALNNLFVGRTVIIIAHRLQTVKHADEILYIDNGGVMESGTHEELLALGQEYYTMVEIQTGF